MLSNLSVLVSAIIAILGYIINNDLQRKKDIIDNKRKVYEVFLVKIHIVLNKVALNDYMTTNEGNKTRLDAMESYNKVVLWGSQEVIDATGELFRNLSLEDIASANKAYKKIIHMMRKDLKVSKGSEECNTDVWNVLL